MARLRLLLLAALFSAGAFVLIFAGATITAHAQEGTLPATVPLLAVTNMSSAPAPPTPTPACRGLLPARLVPYERGRVSSDDPRPLNVREGPGTNFAILGQLPVGALFYVIEGPQCSDLYTWFRIAYRQEGETRRGWIAEGDSSSYFVELYPPGW